MNNYKVTVREVREWTFLIEAQNAVDAPDKAMTIVKNGEPPHVDWFEKAVYEVKHIPLTHEHNQEQQ